MGDLCCARPEVLFIPEAPFPDLNFVGDRICEGFFQMGQNIWRDRAYGGVYISGAWSAKTTVLI